MSRLLKIVVASAFALTACQGYPRATFDGPAYPESAPKLETLNVQVVVGAVDITLTSGEPRNFGPGEVWLNRWFAAEIDGLDRGERLVVPLSAFRNEAGLPPKSGGFFATREPDDIVLAELHTGAGLYGLRVVGERD